jgi:hypothetical protein
METGRLIAEFGETTVPASKRPLPAPRRGEEAHWR